MNKDKLLSAYLDGELTVSESDAFEKSKSHVELEHIRKEKHFEEVLNNHLTSGVSCPDHLWLEIIKEIKSKKKPILLYLLTSAAALAACLMFFFKSDIEAERPSTIAELNAASLIKGTLIDVNRFLSENKIDLTLSKMMVSPNHTQKIIGANIENIDGDEIVTLYFDCCGSPVKVYILPKESNAEKFVQKKDSSWNDNIKAQSKSGNYRLALIAKHGGMNILSSLS
jgi:hypothetical protein